jgi:hypothetical protein
MKEAIMSGSHGDKARFDRERKKKNRRQKRTRELRKALLSENKAARVESAESK